MTVKPRKLAHRGRIEAHGFYFDAQLYPEAIARARIIELWCTGASAYQLDLGLVMTLPKAKRLDVREAPGAPLVLKDRRLLAAPLDDDELEALGASDGALLIKWGVVEQRALRADQKVDPSEWLNLGDLRFLQVAALGEPPAPPKVVVSEPKTSVREVFSSTVPPVSEEASTFIELLRRRKQGKKPEKQNTKSSEGRGFSSALDRFFSWLSELSKPAKPKASKDEKEQRAFLDDVKPSAPSGPSVFDRLGDRLHALFSKLAFKTRLASMFGKAQAKYFDRLMGMLEEGNLDDALRHAIPLNDLNEGGEPGQAAFGVPSPRSGLNFSGRGGRGGRSFILPESLFDTLKAKYRRAFERLKAAGRIEEAAYVLAELLNEPEEAVLLLEQHKHYALAAKIAEARELAPGLIIRQWILAGEWVRAVRIARRTGDFADAVVRLDKTHRDQAKSLRLLWADYLAEKGDFLAAIDVLWPIEEARHLVAPWINSGIELGGPASARILVKALALFPEKQGALRPLVLDMIEDESIEGAFNRQTFTEAALNHGEPAAATLFVKPMIRALLRDATAHRLKTGKNIFDKLLKWDSDPVFKTDLPSIPSSVRIPALEDRALDPIRINVPSSDVGSVRIESAAALQNGRFLVALGEAGVMLVDRKGRPLRHFDLPCDELVISDFDHRAITINRRGDLVRLGKIDLFDQRYATWCEAQLGVWAPTFDGAMWFASLAPSGAMIGLDATTARYQALWQVNDLSASKIARNETALSVLTQPAPKGQEQAEQEIWSYELPAMLLRKRADVRPPWELIEGSVEGGMLFPDGSLIYLTRKVEPPGEVRSPDGPTRSMGWLISQVRDGAVQTSFALKMSPLAAVLSMERQGDWLVLTTLEDLYTATRFISIRTGQVCAHIILENAMRSLTRSNANRTLIWDDRGRLLMLDLTQGQVLANLRLSI